jgi:hypothetical protein
MRPVRDLMGAILGGSSDRVDKPFGETQPSPVPNLDAVVPRLLEDPLLEPVDKVVWLVIRQHTAENPKQHRLFPSYREIAGWANIASVSTVSRAVAILRMTRWLSIHSEGRAPDGRFSGQSFKLHAMPPLMTATLAADQGYLPFIRAACEHHHARVRRVAHSILAATATDIKDDLPSNRPVTELPPVTTGAEKRVSDSIPSGARFSYRTSPVTRLQNAPQSTPPTDCDQNSNALDPVRFLHDQKSNSPSSSCCLYKPTTPETADVRNSNRGAPVPQLVYPERLTPEQRETAARQLTAIPGDLRQAVLDELEGRLRAERQGAKPVYDALSYLRHLCGKAAAGDFEANLGLKIRDERRRRQEEAERRRQAQLAQQAAERRKQEPRVRRDASAQIAALKAALGGRTGPEPGQDTTDED